MAGDEIPTISRVVLRIERADGENCEIDYARPVKVQVEHAAAWQPVDLAVEAIWVGGAPLAVSMKFEANTTDREPVTMRNWSGSGGPQSVLDAFVKATGWSYQEALDRAAARCA